MKKYKINNNFSILKKIEIFKRIKIKKKIKFCQHLLCNFKFI